LTLLYQDNLYQNQQTRVLLEVAAAAANTNDMSSLFRKVIDLSRQILGVQAGAVLLSTEMESPPNRVPRIYFHYISGTGGFGFTNGQRNFSLDLEELGPEVYQQLKSAQPLIANHASALGTSRLTQMMVESKVHNLILVPMLAQDHLLGVLLLGNKASDFTPSDAALLIAMASHLSAALHNTQLLEDTRNRLKETEALQRISALISSNLSRDDLLKVVVKEIATLLGAQGVCVALPDRTHQVLLPHLVSLYRQDPHFSPPTAPLDQANPLTAVYLERTKPDLLEGDPEQGYTLYLPLNTPQGKLGVVVVWQKDLPFTRHQVDLASAVVNQTAVRLQSIGLFAIERQRADLMLLINRIAQEISATLDMRQLMRSVVMHLHETLGYDTVFIFMADENAPSHLTCQASAATNPSHLIEVGFSFGIDDGIAGRTFRQRKTQLIQDVQQDPDYTLYPGHDSLKRALVVPLQHSNNIYGVLEILGLESTVFNESDVMAMESLAAQISVAIDNARLYNQAQRRLLEQSIVYQIGQDLSTLLDYNELVRAVARHMTRALDTSSCLVAIYNILTDQVRIEADYRLPGVDNRHPMLKVGLSYHLNRLHAARQAIQSRRSITVYTWNEQSDSRHADQLRQDGAYSELIVPMKRGDRIIGLVRWAEARHQRQFSRDDERLAQNLAAQAAVAIENTRLFREAERRANEQSILNRLILMLTNVSDESAMLSLLVEQIHELLDATNTVLRLVDENGWQKPTARLNSLSFEQTILYQLEAKPQQGRQISTTLRGGYSVFTGTNAATQTPVQMEVARWMPDELRAVILVPLMFRDQWIGAIEVSSAPPQALDNEAVLLLEAIANQAVIALDNLRLSKREQRRIAQLERLQVSGRLIASALVKENLLKLVINEAAAIFQVDAVAFAMPDETGVAEVIHAAHGLSEAFIARRRSIIPSTKEFAALSEEERRQPIYIPDLSQVNLSEVQRRLIEQEGLQTSLIVPIVKGERRFGALILHSRQKYYRFADEDLEIAQLLTSQVAIALENAELFLALEERARELDQANRLKSQFLANISHELRTPMNSILGFSDAMLSGLYGELNEAQTQRLQRINANGRNLLSLIDDLLDISKIDAGRLVLKVDAVDLRQEFERIVSTFESQIQMRGISMTSELPPDLPLVKADPLRLHQVIMNLVGNAVKFTRQGTITLRAESRLEVVLAPSEGQASHQAMVWVSIADTGIGISLENQLIIFDEFRQADGTTTREYGGTGLGLAICKRLIELMGGRIWVDSEEGVGSTFTFALPAIVPKEAKLA
jgi:GAF domain-containing protein